MTNHALKKLLEELKIFEELEKTYEKIDFGGETLQKKVSSDRIVLIRTYPTDKFTDNVVRIHVSNIRAICKAMRAVEQFVEKNAGPVAEAAGTDLLKASPEVLAVIDRVCLYYDGLLAVKNAEIARLRHGGSE